MRCLWSKKLPLVVLTILILILQTAHESEAVKKKKAPPTPALPPYKMSGPIPGTQLQYEKLFISDNGHVTITIYNPEDTGLSFSSNFGFYTDNNLYVTGFIVRGFANRKDRVSFAMDLADPQNFKKTAYMKVLGRASRKSVE
ncbi:MAG: hypothetical protein LBT08_06780 [Synergistaceae bacterium]|jgi:hypothetical protein|nr:hypothetical protein [Synergistaceae bacterium]